MVSPHLLIYIFNTQMKICGQVKFYYNVLVNSVTIHYRFSSFEMRWRIGLQLTQSKNASSCWVIKRFVCYIIWVYFDLMEYDRCRKFSRASLSLNIQSDQNPWSWFSNQTLQNIVSIEFLLFNLASEYVHNEEWL